MIYGWVNYFRGTCTDFLTCIILSNFYSSELCCYCSTHFTDEKTQLQKTGVICPGPLQEQAADPTLNSLLFKSVPRPGQCASSEPTMMVTLISSLGLLMRISKTNNLLASGNRNRHPWSHCQTQKHYSSVLTIKTTVMS